MSGSRTPLETAAEAGCRKGKARCDKTNSEKIVSARNHHSWGAVLSEIKGGVTCSSETASSNIEYTYTVDRR